VVVPYSSAIIGLPAEIEESMPINGDHATIVKYDSETDPNYISVSKTIARTIGFLLQGRNSSNDVSGVP